MHGIPKVRRSARGGFQLIDLLTTFVLFSVSIGAFASMLGQAQEASVTVDARTQASQAAFHGLQRVLADLKHSGFDELGTRSYPHLFEHGVTSWAEHAHAAPAGSGSDVFAREVVFLRPADADDDGVPDLDAQGALVWDDADFSYVLVPKGDGTNALERRVDGAQARTVARDVTAFVVDDHVSSGYTVPLGSLRVRLTVRRLSGDGTPCLEDVVGVVTLCNGDFQ